MLSGAGNFASVENKLSGHLAKHPIGDYSVRFFAAQAGTVGVWAGVAKTRRATLRAQVRQNHE
jgi:hypothetical protein